MTNTFVDIIRVWQKTLDMTKYLDDLNVPPRYTKIVEKHSDDLKNFVGMRCGVPIFSGAQEVTNPTTKEPVGYAQYIQLGQNPVTIWNGMSRYRVGVGSVLTKIDDLLGQEYRRKLSIDMGLAGVRGATLAGAAGGALEWFNFAPTVSLSGVAAGIATGGLSFAYNRQRRKKEFGAQIKRLSECFSSMGRRAVRPNLLAPDSYVSGDMQTGLADSQGAGNIYFIGDMPVDQQQRADRFWHRADQILEEYGFTEWQDYQSAGLPALIERILDDFDGNGDFSYDEKRSAGDSIKSFTYWRDTAIEDMKCLQDEAESQRLLQQYDSKGSKRQPVDRKGTLVASGWALLSKVIGHEDDELRRNASSMLPSGDSRRTVTQQIRSLDRKYEEHFRKCIKRLREIVIDSRKRINQSELTKTYGGESRLQKIFWGELSEILARNDIDPYDESASQSVRFILDLPKIVPGIGRDQLPSADRLNELRGIFQRICSQNYPDVRTSSF